jgi:hypothetical protein
MSQQPMSLPIVNLPDAAGPQQPEAQDDAVVKPLQSLQSSVTVISKPSHLLYAVEMLAFAAIGWAWLAVREFMGDTPVMDVTVFITLLIASGVNLLLALYYHTPEEFRTSAQAFVNLVVCVWALYAYTLFESTTDGRSAICCRQDGA